MSVQWLNLCDPNKRHGFTSSSRQRRNLVERLASLGKLPVVQERLLVLCRPLQHAPQDLPWEAALVEARGVDRDYRLVVAVQSMEVRRRMIGVVHINRDAVELADLRHVGFVTPS